MSIYFSTNIPELRSIIDFNRVSLQISDSMRKLETGQRINRAADDPAGLIIRESMRADIKGIEAAQRNAVGASGVLNAADSGLNSITKIIRGEMDDDSGMSLLAIVNSADLTSDEKKAAIVDRLTLIDGVASSITYNNTKVLGGDLAYKTSGVNQSVLQNLKIDRANQNTTVNIRNTQAAQKGTLSIDNSQLNGAVAGDTITVGLQNKTQKTYALQADDVDVDGKITQEATDRINDALRDSGVTASFQNGNLVFETNDYGDAQTLSVTSSNSLISGATKNASGNVASDATGSNATFLVNGSAVTANGAQVSFYGSDLRFSTNLAESMLSTQGATQSFSVTGGGATFNLGKDVGVNQIKLGIGNASSAFLGGASGNLTDLMDLNFDNEADSAKASRIVNEALNSVVKDRARIGTTVKNVEITGETLDNQLVNVTAAEAAISNTNVAMESSRLARLELLAESAMNSILFSRQYAQFVAGSLY